MPLPFWSKPKFVVFVILLYLAVHLAIRMAAGPSLSVDDAEQALFSQHFAWAYSHRAAPLPAWIAAALGLVMPVDAFATGLLRYTLLGVLYLFIYLAARRLVADPRLSALSVYSFAAIGTFAEASHRNLTHSTALAASIAVAWYVFVRLAAAPRLGWYLALGAVFGVGTLAKWNFTILAVALPLACLLTRDGRRLVLNWNVLPAAAVAAAIVMPTLLETLRIDTFAGESLTSVLHAETGPGLGQIGKGTLKLLDTAIVYSLPLAVVAVVILGLPIWRGIRTAFRSTATATSSADQGSSPSFRPDAVLVGLTIVLGLAILWGFVLILGATEFKVRYVYPALLILPVWLFMIVEHGRPSARALNLFALVLVATTLFVAGKRLSIVVGAVDCSGCMELRPYGPLANQLADAGYNGKGTILTDSIIGGNMRALFPGARMAIPIADEGTLPPPSGMDQCILVWPETKEIEMPDIGLPQLEAHLVDSMLGRADAPYHEGVLAAPMLAPAKGELRLGYRLYDAPNGDCR